MFERSKNCVCPVYFGPVSKPITWLCYAFSLLCGFAVHEHIVDCFRSSTIIHAHNLRSQNLRWKMQFVAVVYHVVWRLQAKDILICLMFEHPLFVVELNRQSPFHGRGTACQRQFGRPKCALAGHLPSTAGKVKFHKNSKWMCRLPTSHAEQYWSQKVKGQGHKAL